VIFLNTRIAQVRFKFILDKSDKKYISGHKLFHGRFANGVTQQPVRLHSLVRRRALNDGNCLINANMCA
jgi:hypothetical protein